MKRCFIFGALPVRTLFEKPIEGDVIIAADKGYMTVTALGLIPDLVVGDFDSLGEVPDAENLIRLNVRKDDTDLEHAVRLALEKGCDDFIVYGAVGGKLDHTMGNIAIAELIAQSGGRSLFYGDDSSFSVIRNGEFTLPAFDSGRISVFSLSERSRGVTIRGLSYTADRIDLLRAVPRGVSNAFIGKPSAISVADGTLLIIFDTQSLQGVV